MVRMQALSATVLNNASVVSASSRERKGLGFSVEGHRHRHRHPGGGCDSDWLDSSFRKKLELDDGLIAAPVSVTAPPYRNREGIRHGPPASPANESGVNRSEDRDRGGNVRLRRPSSSSSSSSSPRVVRFTPGTLPEPPTKRIPKKRPQPLYFDDDDDDESTTRTRSSDDRSFVYGSDRWYTKRELKDIQESCVMSVQARAFAASLGFRSNNSNNNGGGGGGVDGMLLDRFSSRTRKRRKLVRWQMYETTKAVQAFERACGFEVPRRLLKDLLGLYSRPMEDDALETAARIHRDEHHHQLGVGRGKPAVAVVTAAGGKAVAADGTDASLERARLQLERSLRTRSPPLPAAASSPRQHPR